MSTEITDTTKKPVTALAVMGQSLNVDPLKLHQTLKNTVFKGASDDELLSLVVVANSYGLNPLTKEIYAFPAKGGGIVPVVSVDGWLNIANSHPQMDGVDYEFEHGDKGDLISCTCIIHRKDRARPVRVTEFLSECRRNTEPWKMEHRMLRHKAFIQCCRVAFGFSGIHDEDEAGDIAINSSEPKRVEAREVPLDPFAGQQAGGGIHSATTKAADVVEDVRDDTPSQPAAKVEETQEPSVPPPAEAAGPPLRDAYISLVKRSHGTKNNKPWNRFAVTLAFDEKEVIAVTFSTRLGKMALENLDRFVLVHIEGDEKSPVLKDLRECDQETREELVNLKGEGK